MHEARKVQVGTSIKVQFISVQVRRRKGEAIFLPNHLSNRICWRSLFWNMVLCKLIDRVFVGIGSEGGVFEMMSMLPADAMRGCAQVSNKLLGVDLKNWTASVSQSNEERGTNMS
jgi:hypothetical protein